MSDSKNNPKIPPPDDFSKTTPNINFDGEDTDAADWEKTRIGVPSEAPADDWGKTVINYDISANKNESDPNQNRYENNSPKEPDWGMTQAHIDIDRDFGAGDSGRSSAGSSDFGRSGEENEYGAATTPYFKLPEAERAKYQNLPPTPTEKAQREAQEKKGGVPVWFWVAAGLMTMFTFALVVLIGGYFLFFGKSGFELTIKGAQPGSQVLVDGSCCWGVSASDGTIRLYNLRAGNRNIIIRRQGFTDDNHAVPGDNGDTKMVIARQQKSAPPPDDCAAIKSGEISKAEKCANQALDNLSNPPDLDALLKALNLYYINFESGSHQIPPERLRFLERAATYLKQLPASVRIEIGGHTDSDGSDASNQALSEKRAAAVKDALVKFGVNETMLTAKGFGEAKPRPGNTNSTDDEKFQNRRIEYMAIKR